MDNNIICHECGTENEPQYVYCKNCGTLLKTETNKQSQNQNNYNYTAGNTTYQYQQSGKNGYNTTYNQNVAVESIEGVPTEDMVAFVGKKSYNIIPKFSKMELAGSKASWCWPAAVLGFLFGPLGAAIWFFYRKMYKAAVIFMAIGIVFSAAVGIIAGPITDKDFLQGVVESYYSGDYEGFYNGVGELLRSEDTVRSIAASVLDSAVRIATMIVAGMFGFYFYKRHAVRSINRYRDMSVDPRYYKIGLASIGGTSSGMAVLGVAILVPNLLSWLTLLV